MRRAVLVVLVAACHAASAITPDAHPDAVIVLPDAPPAGDPCTGPLAPADLGACLGKAYCARLAQCGFGDAGDTDCSNLAVPISGDITPRTLASAITSAQYTDRASYDPSAAPACLAAIAATPCRSLVYGQIPFDGCQVLVGHLPGGVCGYPFECTPATACAYGSAGYYVDSCGNDVCKTRSPDGAFCDDAPCEAGSRCVYASPRYICASGRDGAACNYDYDCAVGYWCDYPGTSHEDAAGACTAGYGAGHACTSEGQCGGQLTCVGLSLSPTGTCVDTSVAGAPCGGHCYGPLLCAGFTGAQLGTCVAQPAPGDPCSVADGCGVFMRCDDRGTADPADDRCVMDGELGASCAPGACDQGLVCTADISGRATGTCVAPLPDGTGCYNGTECASGTCAGEVCVPFASCDLTLGGGGGL